MSSFTLVGDSFKMEIRFVIVSLACLSCMVTPALGTGLVAKAAALGAAKGAILGGIKGAAMGAGIGLIAKGAAAMVTKKALLSIALKAAAIKGTALMAAKKAIVQGIGSLAIKGITAAKGAITSLTRIDCASRINCNQPISIMDILSGVVQSQTRNAIENMPVVYRIISAPRTFAVPIEVYNLRK